MAQVDVLNYFPLLIWFFFIFLFFYFFIFCYILPIFFSSLAVRRFLFLDLISDILKLDFFFSIFNGFFFFGFWFKYFYYIIRFAKAFMSLIRIRN